MTIDVEDFDNARIDRIIWNGLGSKSISQIAMETGIPPEKVHQRRRELFEQIDVLTIQEQQVKAMVSMQEIAEKARQKIDSIGDERNWSGAVNAAVNAQEKILKQVRALAKEDDSKVEQLNALRLRELLRLIDRVVQAGSEELADTYDLELEEVLEVFRDHLESEARNMEIEKL